MSKNYEDGLKAMLLYLKRNKFESTLKTLVSECSDKLIKQVDPHNLLMDAIDGCFSRVSYEILTHYFCESAAQLRPQCARIYDMFKRLLALVERDSTDAKPHFHKLLYPIFVHCYMYLTYNNFCDWASAFFNDFFRHIISFNEHDMAELSAIKSFAALKSSKFAACFHQKRYVVSMPKSAIIAWKKLLHENAQINKLFFNISRYYIDIQEVDEDFVFKENDLTRSSVIGQVSAYNRTNNTNTNNMLALTTINTLDRNNINSLFCSFLNVDNSKKISELSTILNNNNNTNTIPYPKDKPNAYLNKIELLREELAKLKELNYSTNILFYRLQDATRSVVCCDMPHSCKYAVVGYDDGRLSILSLTEHKLTKLKNFDDISHYDKNLVDLNDRIMTQLPHKEKVFYGHEYGPVTSVKLDQMGELFFISGSVDGTCRLWSLVTHKSVAAFKGHCRPVWDIDLCSKSYYFASGGADCVARLWSVERVKPVRLMAGHVDEVTSVLFHNSCNMLMTFSEDRTIKYWDNASGRCVRSLHFFKQPVIKSRMSYDGNYLICGDANSIKLVDMRKDSACLSTFEYSEYLGDESLTNFEVRYDQKELYASFTDGTILQFGGGLGQEEGQQQLLPINVYKPLNCSTMYLKFNPRMVLCAVGAGLD